MTILYFVIFIATILSPNGKLQLFLRLADELNRVNDVLAVDITNDAVFVYQLVDKQADLLGINFCHLQSFCGPYTQAANIVPFPSASCKRHCLTPGIVTGKQIGRAHV